MGCHSWADAFLVSCDPVCRLPFVDISSGNLVRVKWWERLFQSVMSAWILPDRSVTAVPALVIDLRNGRMALVLKQKRKPAENDGLSLNVLPHAHLLDPKIQV